MNSDVGQPVMFAKWLILMPVVALVALGCSKDDEVVPEDPFVGFYTVSEVIEEFDPTEPGSEEEKFLAPSEFEIQKEQFLDPTTGTFFTAYKLFIMGDFITGLQETGTGNLEGELPCPNSTDIRSVNIALESTLHRLSMVNCEFREVIADYTKIISEE